MIHDAVLAGNDTDGTAIYVGRYNNEFAKIIPAKKEAYISDEKGNLKKITSYDVTF